MILTKFETAETFFQAERRFLNSKPTCFIVIGKPVSSFSDLFMVPLVNKLITVLKYCSFITHQLLTSFEVNMNTRGLVYSVVAGTSFWTSRTHCAHQGTAVLLGDISLLLAAHDSTCCTDSLLGFVL